jgi:hypothetical protein
VGQLWGLSEPEIGLEHAFVLLIWEKDLRSTTNGKIRTVPACKNNCKLLEFFLSLPFDIIRESPSTTFGFVTGFDYCN